MSDFTANLNLELPDFNVSPWHDAVNDNFTAIDAVLFNTFGVTNIKGRYTNSTAVIAGDKYYDEVSSILYQVVTSYVTGATTTFLEERIAVPANWAPIAVATADAAIAISAALRDEVIATALAIDADVATVAGDKAIVAADKAIVIADKAIVLGYKNDAAASAVAAAAAANSLLEWKGPWVTAFAYGLSDIVFQAGSAYICVTAHTSGVFATDFAASRWQIFAQQPSGGAGTGDTLNANNLSDMTNKPLAYATIGGRAVGLVDLLTYSLIDPAAIITDVETLLTNKAVASALPNAKAVADYVDSLVGGATNYPINKAAWYPHDAVVAGDAASGIIYSFAVHGSVATVTTADFDPDYDYRFEGQGVTFTGGLAFHTYRETDLAYDGGTGLGTSNVDFEIDLYSPRAVKRSHNHFGFTFPTNSSGMRLPTPLQSNSYYSSQGRLRAQFLSPGVLTGGTIRMFKRLSFR